MISRRGGGAHGQDTLFFYVEHCKNPATEQAARPPARARPGRPRSGKEGLSALMSDRLYDLARHPFTVIENALLECKNLGIYEKMVFIMLKKCGGKSGSIFPGVNTLAGWIGCSGRQVQKCIASLSEKGLVRRIPRKNKSNIYVLMDFTYDGTSIRPKAGRRAGAGTVLRETRDEPQDVGGEPHSPHMEGRGEPGSPGGECHSPGGERGSPIKVLLKKNHIKESSSKKGGNGGNGKGPGGRRAPGNWKRNLVDEWKEVFGRNLPKNAGKEMITAADYMLYLWAKGELGGIKRPVAYLKGMVRQGFPRTGWPTYPERLERREILARKERERRMREEENRNEVFRLKAKWDALPEPEKKKWALEAEKRDGFRVLPSTLRPYMAWMTSSEIHDTYK